MIPRELDAEIRRLFYAEHWRIETIATALGVHHDTVRRAIEADRFIRPGAQIRPSQLDPYKTFITATLEQYPRLRATRLFAMIRDRGYPGSAIQVRRYVRTVRPQARAEAYLRLDTLPGEQAQVDWGNFGALQIGRARRLLSCFVLVLSWSRAMYARFALDQTLESFLRGHVEAFITLRGVPRTILYDNLKSVVLERIGARDSPVSLPTGPPTEPDVQVSRIRLFETTPRTGYTTPYCVTCGRGSGNRVRKIRNASHVSRRRWPRRRSHLYQIRPVNSRS